MSNIKGIRAYKQLEQSRTAPKAKSDSGFGSFMKGVATGSLTAVATVGSAAPGGGLIAGVANGLSSIITGGGGNSAQQEQLDKMWAMQRESQMFNMAMMTSASVLPRRSATPYSVTTMSRRWRGIVV